MAHDGKGSCPLRTEADIVMSRQVVRGLTQQLKFSLVDQTKMITAASELSRNTVVYGGGGEMAWEILDTGAKTGLLLKFSDKGPGIPDMGLGLSGSKRLVHEFDIQSAVGEGTCVSITRWK